MKPEYKVLPRIPEDSRLIADRHTHTLFPITKFFSREEVEKRREELRFNLRMAAGLYPWPEKTPLNPKYEHIGDYEGYSIKKVMFESRPGFWSTGNLYLPNPMPKKVPAILNVIGHWEPQRLTRQEDADYPQQLANFARMGFICLVTDMIGKVDSLQISHEYGKNEKELWKSNGLGIQLWNNVRALDLLCSMPEVDSEKIGMTGASGGGSQTLFLSLVDDRIKAAAPINMISLQMQGGCQCENAAGLRRHTDNSEMCAMLAPRPLFLAGSTGDWTKDQETMEYPAMLETYRQYEAENMVEHYYQVADHQYNAKTRQRVYSFFSRHLMGREMNWVEQPIEVADVQDLTWFRGCGHALGFENDDEFYAAHKAERAADVAALSAEEKRKMLGWMTGIDSASPVTADGDLIEMDGITIEKNVVTAAKGEQIPYIRLIPANWDGKRVCLALGGNGKMCVDNEMIQRKLAEGISVISGDLFMTGEFEGAEKTIRGGERGSNYFTTFHDTTDSFRAQDVALLWKVALSYGSEGSLWADGCAARAVACALPLLENVVSAQLERKALSLESEQEYFEHCFVPGLMTLGGLEGCLKLAECRIELF